MWFFKEKEKIPADLTGEQKQREARERWLYGSEKQWDTLPNRLKQMNQYISKLEKRIKLLELRLDHVEGVEWPEKEKRPPSKKEFWIKDWQDPKIERTEDGKLLKIAKQ